MPWIYKKKRKLKFEWINSKEVLTNEPSIARLATPSPKLWFEIVSWTHSVSHLLVRHSLAFQRFSTFGQKICQRFTYVNIFWIPGHVSLTMEQATSRCRSLRKPDFSWSTSTSSISSICNPVALMFSSLSFEHDWNTVARSSSFRSYTVKVNFSRFFNEQIIGTNEQVYDKSYSIFLNSWVLIDLLKIDFDPPKFWEPSSGGNRQTRL